MACDCCITELICVDSNKKLVFCNCKIDEEFIICGNKSFCKYYRSFSPLTTCGKQLSCNSRDDT